MSESWSIGLSDEDRQLIEVAFSTLPDEVVEDFVIDSTDKVGDIKINWEAHAKYAAAETLLALHTSTHTSGSPAAGQYGEHNLVTPKPQRILKADVTRMQDQAIAVDFLFHRRIELYKERAIRHAELELPRADIPRAEVIDHSKGKSYENDV